MSTLLEKASLVMIPSGYKEDIVYSQIPTNGNGDLSFTRASNGTRVNSAGLVEVTPWNLVEYSEEFDNGVWSKYQASVTANTTTAPNGTLTADTLQDNTANDSHITYQTPNITAGTYTISVYAKASTLSNINLVLFDGVSTSYGSNRFDLSNGTTTGANQSIENVGNGWYRCSFTLTTTLSGVQFVYVFLNNGTSSVYTGTGSGAVFIWGYQFNIGSTAKPYFPTTDRLNVPRLTYQNGGGGCPSLLLEKQSTNLMLWSEQFDDAIWDKSGSTISANATTSPDGTQNADKFIPNNGNQLSWVLQDFVPSAGIYTYSIYVKSSDFSFVQITGSIAFANEYQNYNIANGTLASYSGAQGSIQSMGNGWYRLIYTLTASATGQARFIVSAQDSGTAGRLDACTGNGTKFISIWGAQLEQSSYATSYISTQAASATRVADACFKTGISSLIGTDFTVFFDGYQSTGGSSSRYLILKGSGSAYANAVFFESNPSRQVACSVLNSSANLVFGPLSTSLASGQRLKFALRCKNNDFAFYMNGVSQGSQASGTVPTTADLYVGYYTDYTDNYNVVNQVSIFNTGLSNSDLIALTTL